MDLDGFNEVRVTALDDNEVSPSWLPAGGQILFYCRNLRGVETYRQAPSPYPQDRVLVHTLPATSCSSVEGLISASQSGSMIFAGSFCGDLTSQGIYRLPPGGGEVEPLRTSAGLTSEGAVTLHAPAWSPNGEHIAFLELLLGADDDEPTFSRTRVKRMSASGDSVVVLATLETDGRGQWASSNTISLAWSPDGSKIAFNKREGELTSHIYVVGSDGEGLVRVTSEPGASDMSISWSRRQSLFLRLGNEDRLYRLLGDAVYIKKREMTTKYTNYQVLLAPRDAPRIAMQIEATRSLHGTAKRRRRTPDRTREILRRVDAYFRCRNRTASGSASKRPRVFALLLT